MRASSFALLLIYLTSQPVTGQPRSEGGVATVTAPVEVVASRLPEGVAPRARLIAVVNRVEIDERQPGSVHDLLAGLAGVDVSEQGPTGGLSFVSIRGGDPNFTLFLVDGVAVNDPTNSRGGGFDLYQIDPAVIERIEVYAGSLSSVHGSGALGGIVSITTRRHDEKETGARLRAGLGSDGRRGYSASAGGALDATTTWTVAAATSDGGDAVTGNRLERRQLSGRLESRFNSDSRGSLQFMTSNGEASAFPEDSGGSRLAVIRAAERREFQRILAAADLEVWLGENWSLQSSLSLTALREATDSPGIAAGVLNGIPPVRGVRHFTRKDLTLALKGYLHESLAVTLGGGYGHEEGSSDDVIDFGVPVPSRFELQRGTAALFAEASFSPVTDLELGGGIRHDRPESERAETVGQLSAAYRLPGYGTRVHAEWSQGFKLPSFFALGSPLVGNPSLRPERSTQFEAGIRQALYDGGLEVGLTWFRARYRDLIDFDPVAFTNINRGRVEAEGIEGRFALRLGAHLSATATATYNSLQVAPGAAPLRRRPRWKGAAGLRWVPTSRWTARVDATWRGSFFDSSIPTGLRKMPGFWRLDAAVRWRAASKTTLALSVQNLLSDDYESSIGFPNGGAAGFVSIELAL